MPDPAKNILHAAAGLFARKGYGPTSVRAIAKSADVTVPMVYYYFEGKEQIFTTLFDCIGDHFSAKLDDARSQTDRGFDQQLLAIAHVFRELLYPCPVTLQLIIQYVFGPPESHPGFDSQSQDVQRERFARFFEQATASGRFRPTPGFEPAELAHIFVIHLHAHMMFVMKLIEEPGVDCRAIYDQYLDDKALQKVISIFLKGAGKISPA